MIFDADVIVVGAGPAGSMAAFMLVSEGVKVLVLEKSLFPRYKVCGGGLTHKILKEILFDISPVIETTIHAFRFSHKYENVFTRISPDPLMYCTMRADLDDFLLQKAIEAGAEIRMGEQVVSFEQEKTGVTVSTKDKSYRCSLLIGSEGASGIISRTAGLRNKIELGLAWEMEVNAEPDDLKHYSDTVFLDWGTLPGGYAWVFPKKDHFSIGVGGPAYLSKAMMPYYDKFMQSIAAKHTTSTVNGIHFLDTFSKSSWPIPVRTRKSMFHNGRVIVTGDSAGLGDPLTGEGIYYAIRSGKLAAETVLEFLSGNLLSMNNYSERINDELMEELIEANKIKHVFNAVPMKIHNFVGKSDRAWRAFGKILRGERWYKDVRLGFGKWKFFWRLMVVLSVVVENIKIMRIRNT
jgi:geranylgeranyl reductase family protein